MNIRNSFGLKYLALMLLAAFTFTSCEEDEFTAEEAYALEEQRLQLLEQFRQDRQQQQFDNEMAMRRFQNTVDSLRRINAGGRVLYTVVVVPGESSVFAGGRLEEAEGLAGVTVTAEQFGISTPVTTDEAGVASFLLYSGEVTINATVDGYTDANYVSNLTPDGGVPNSTVAHVGNVLPVFFNDAAAADAQDRMAMIEGRFFAELDVTDFQEEVLTSSTDYLAGTPGVAAYIDPNMAFRNEYLRENFDEGLNIDGDVVRSGFIQRIAYETAGGVARPDASGDYSLMVPATGSGLQTRMEYSEFIASRTFVSANPFDFQDGDVVGGAFGGFLSNDNRVLYGPNVTPDAFPTIADLFSVLFGVPSGATVLSLLASDGVVNTTQFTIAPATVTATIASDGSLENPQFDVIGGTTQDGAYLAVPTGTFPAPSAGGTTASITFELDGNTVTGTSLEGIDIDTFSGGSGYTSADLNYDSDGNGTLDAIRVTITPQSTGAAGTGTIQQASNALNTAFVQILDGGFGFRNSDIGSEPGDWTGISPWINYPDDGAGNPSGVDGITATFQYDDGGTGTGTGADATSIAYNPTGNLPSNTGAQVFGTVQQIAISSGGDDWTQALLDQLNTTPFRYFLAEASFPVSDGTDNLFDLQGTGDIQFDPDYGDGNTNTAANTISPGLNATANTLDLTALTTNFQPPAGYSAGSGYVFVPNASLVNTRTGRRFTCGVSVAGWNGTAFDANAGEVVTINLPTGDVTDGQTGMADTEFRLEFSAPTNSLDAEFTTEGGSIDNYTITSPGTNFATGITSNPDTGIGLTVPNSLGAVGDADAQNNSYVAIFSDPATGSTFAYAYPVFDDATNPNAVTGLEMYSGGIGYSTTQNVTWSLEAVDQFDAVAFAEIEDAQINFSVTDGGTYALTPRVRVYEGGSFAYNFVDASAGVDMNPDGSIDDIASVPAPGFFDGTTALEVIVDTDEPEASADAVLNGFFAGGVPGDDANFDFFHLAGSGVDPEPTGSLTGLEYVSTDGTAGNAIAGDEVWNSAAAMTRFGADAYETLSGGDPAWITDFFVNVDGLLGGTGAIADITISRIDGTYVSTTLRTGGSNYFAQISANNEEAFQGFRVLGGPDGNPASTNAAFETFTGLSYARDIHYGSGQLLE